MAVGSNIKKRRFELGMSQQELADALGYRSRSTIAKIESGENDVSHKKLQKFAEVLDTTVESLITGIPSSQSRISLKSIDFTDEEVETANPADRNRNVAVILAGGKSVRNHQNIPNQFINILGKPVIVYCLEAYQTHPAIDDIYVVCLKGWDQIVTAYAEQYNITKLRGLIPAASSGILSAKNGLDSISPKYNDDDVVIFQESTRPMVTVDMISKLLQACYEKGSANICQSKKDYIEFTCAHGQTTYIDRDTVVELQSPEAYHLSMIKDIFKKAQQQHHQLTETCCAMLMYNLGYDINFIEGSSNNIKLIRQEDITVVTALINQKVSR